MYFQLLNLLKRIIKEQQKDTKAFPFDPKATIFVPNRFDAVPMDAKENVKKHIVEKLSNAWPMFDESMVVFFSTKNAHKDILVHPDYVNENYRHLLQKFRDLVCYVMDRHLRDTYK